MNDASMQPSNESPVITSPCTERVEDDPSNERRRRRSVAIVLPIEPAVLRELVKMWR